MTKKALFEGKSTLMLHGPGNAESYVARMQDLRQVRQGKLDKVNKERVGANKGR
jgi:hypothetical protein